MPVVEPETEALHFFRAVQALLFAVGGTALVLLTVPALTVNFLWTTFAAIASIFVIVPAVLAVRRAARNRPAEPTVAFRDLRRRWAVNQAIFAVLLLVVAKLLPQSLPVQRGHLLVVTLAVYTAAMGLVLRFVPFYGIAAAVLCAAIVPFTMAAPANAFPIAACVTGLLFWVAAFLVFTRITQ